MQVYTPGDGQLTADEAEKLVKDLEKKHDHRAQKLVDYYDVAAAGRTCRRLRKFLRLVPDTSTTRRWRCCTSLSRKQCCTSSTDKQLTLTKSQFISLYSTVDSSFDILYVTTKSVPSWIWHLTAFKLIINIIYTARLLSDIWFNVALVIYGCLLILRHPYASKYDQNLELMVLLSLSCVAHLTTLAAFTDPIGATVPFAFVMLLVAVVLIPAGLFVYYSYNKKFEHPKEQSPKIPQASSANQRCSCCKQCQATTQKSSRSRILHGQYNQSARDSFDFGDGALDYTMTPRDSIESGKMVHFNKLTPRDSIEVM